MKRHLIATLAFGLALMTANAASAAQEQLRDGVLSSSQLLDACTKQDYEWIGFCNGYIQALVDVNVGKNVCLPKGITRNQIFVQLVTHLMAAPRQESSEAFLIGSEALRNIYKCK